MGFINSPEPAPKEEPELTPNSTFSTPSPEKPLGISKQDTATPATAEKLPTLVEEPTLTAPTPTVTEEPPLPDPPAPLPDETPPPLDHDPRDIQKNGEVPTEIPDLVKKTADQIKSDENVKKYRAT